MASASTPLPESPGTGLRGLARQVLDAPRQFVVFCLREKLWLAAMTIFVVTWTVELYAMQAKTLVYPNEVSASFARWAPKIRLVLDVLFVLGLTFALRRRWLMMMMPAVFLINLTLLTYFYYFERPLSILTFLGNWREGAEVGISLDLIPKRLIAWLGLALCIKVVALFVSRRKSLPIVCGWVGAVVIGLAYCSLYAVANRMDPLDAILSTRGVGRLGEIRGYMGPWFAELYYLGDNQILQQAMTRRNAAYDRLNPIEAEIPINNHLAIIQAESFDFNILGYTVDPGNGKPPIEVTPFMNRLRDSSMFYRVRAMHANGSSDADFTILSGVAGSERVNTYLIPGYPFELDTLPQLLQRCGYSMFSFHGNRGDFYNRRPAFEKMGFTDIYFQEELEGRFGLRGARWGVQDRDVLTVSALEFRKSMGPTCHMVITLTTHTPYTLLPPEDREIYPQPRSTKENYINNMRYLDNCLRDYITSLGKNTTVVLYADHPCESDTIKPDRDGAKEYIPVFIYDSDRDLAKMQKTRDQLVSRDGSLNLVDVSKYLRAQIKRICADPEPPRSNDPSSPPNPATAEQPPQDRAGIQSLER